MSARLSRAEIAVLMDDLIDYLNEWDVSNMCPNDAYTLGFLAGKVKAINMALFG